MTLPDLHPLSFEPLLNHANERVLTALDLFKKPDREALWAHYDACCRAYGLSVGRVPVTVKAYISDNRWVADCPVCQSGVGVLPGDPETFCLGCGARVGVLLPVGWQQAERLLAQRAPQHRHWRPHQGEHLNDLARENAAKLMGGAL